MSSIVWLEEEHHHATLVSRNAFTSIVKFTQKGIEYELLVDNDEYSFIEEDDE